MKKILTVSLFAMMAVSAANAEIASTTYVTDRTGTVNFTSGSAAGKTNLTEAIAAVDAKLTTVAGSGTGSVADQITDALTSYTNTTDMNEAIADAQAAAEGKVTELDESLAAVAKSGAYADLTGKPTVDSTFSATSDNAATSKAIASYVTGIKNELSNGNKVAIEEMEEQIADLDTAYKAADTALDGRLTTAEGEIDALQSGKADKATTLAGYGITDAMTATAITSAISTATTDMATNAGVAASIKEVTDVMATDTELSNAVSALEEQIEGAGADTTALAGRVTTAEGEIDALQSGKADKATTLAGYGIADAMTATAINTAIKDANDAQTSAITTAYQAADAATLSSAKTYADGLADNYDAAGSATAAQSAAIAAAKTETTNQVNALANGAVKTNTTNISTITTNLGGLNGITIPEACKSGRCALVMNAGKAEWETINY